MCTLLYRPMKQTLHTMLCVADSPTAIHNGARGEGAAVLSKKLMSSPCICHDTRYEQPPRSLWFHKRMQKHILDLS